MKSERDIKRFANDVRNRLIREHPQYADQLRRILFRTSTRMTASAGSAQYTTGIVRLSIPYFESDINFDKYLENTVTHEIAHIVAGPKHRGHGRVWQNFHMLFGGNGKRCHSLTLAERYQSERFEAPCWKCGKPMSLGKIQAKRQREYMRKFGKGYSHQKCS